MYSTSDTLSFQISSLFHVVYILSQIEGCLTVHLPHEIKRNANLMQLGNFIDVWPIELEIRQRKWGWLGHTLRRPPGDIAKAALEWNPLGTRPRTTWRRTILEEIRHQGKTWKEVKVLAKNRCQVGKLCEGPMFP